MQERESNVVKGLEGPGLSIKSAASSLGLGGSPSISSWRQEVGGEGGEKVEAFKDGRKGGN